MSVNCYYVIVSRNITHFNSIKLLVLYNRFLVGAFINKRARLLQSLVSIRQTRSDER